LSPIPGARAFVTQTLLPRHSRLGRLLRRARSSLRGRGPRGRPYSQAELLARVEEFNRNAETYWRDLASDPAARDVLLRKPFTTVQDASSILYRTGLILSELRLGIGHTVLDLGAGACWLSAFLNRLGCRTVSVDVSPSALELGRELFRLDPRQRLDLDPRFLVYDGRRLPLPDSSVDRVVCFDAFHHVPNEDEILGEIFRVLRPGGRAVFAEPGEGHSHSGQSRLEAERFHVLENELDLVALRREAVRLGFTRFLVKPYPDPEAVTVTAEEHFRFMAGKDAAFPVDDLRRSLREFYVFALVKGAEAFDSRSPHVLKASLRFATPLEALAASPGSEHALTVRVKNVGDTTWLRDAHPAGGYVRLGAHLLDGAGEAVQWDFLRAELPGDVPPGGSATVEACFRAPLAAGPYRLRFDMVDEGVAWFEQGGSTTLELPLRVDAA
jgi:SAM-dependent methyltransferase